MNAGWYPGFCGEGILFGPPRSFLEIAHHQMLHIKTGIVGMLPDPVHNIPGHRIESRDLIQIGERAPVLHLFRRTGPGVNHSQRHYR